MWKNRLKNPIFLIYVLVVYVILQFSWWLYLIFSLYDQIYSDPIILQHKTWMLLGEGSVFFFILIVGIYVILRAFKRERALAKQQENFLLSVTHELKTPIASVKLFLQTLKKRTLEPEKRGEIYERSLQEVNRLDSLVNNLLITRNIENENFFLDKEMVNLKSFIETKVSILKGSILSKHTVNFQLSNQTLFIDKNALDSILTNLLENSSKYAEPNSTIELTLSGDDDHVTIQVKDEGSGISAENLDAVFSKFYREENEMTRKSKGTGLGLYITRYLVRQHKGQIFLNHNKPHGLIVTIQFKK